MLLMQVHLVDKLSFPEALGEYFELKVIKIVRVFKIFI